MLEIFNTRELSLLIWAAIFLIWMLIIPKIRHSLKKVIKSAFQKRLAIIYILMLLYISLFLFSLSKLGWWSIEQLKATIFWFVSTGLATLYSVNKIQENKNYFKDALKDLFAATIFIEYIVGAYTFDIWIELLILPLVILLTGCVAVAQGKPEYSSVKKLLNGFLSLIGLFALGYAVYKVIVSFKEFWTTGTLTDFLLPLALSLLMLPFMYLLSVYMSYETTFILLKNDVKDRGLEKWVKRQAILHFRFRISDFIRWRRSIMLRPIRTKEDFHTSIKEFEAIKEAERNPPKVNSEIGWSPYQAKDYLLPSNVETGHYFDSGDNEWMACSRMIELENDNPFVNKNNIAYYVEGNQETALSLKLLLNVNDKQTSIAAHERLAYLSNMLYKAAMNKDLPTDMVDALLLGNNLVFHDGNRKISANRNNWPTQKGYNVKLTIEVI